MNISLKIKTIDCVFRVSINQANKPISKVFVAINEKLADRKRLLAEIRSIPLNSDERIKAIEVCGYVSSIYQLNFCRF
jgi:hypothetical protein